MATEATSALTRLQFRATVPGKLLLSGPRMTVVPVLLTTEPLPPELLRLEPRRRPVAMLQLRPSAKRQLCRLFRLPALVLRPWAEVPLRAQVRLVRQPARQLPQELPRLTRAGSAPALLRPPAFPKTLLLSPCSART
jgi:hypothetical protein